MKKTRVTLFITFLVLIVSSYLAIRFGSVSDASLDVMIQLRLPRVILAAAVGAALAISGGVLQALFANPLCEPYTLGISSGAALGAVALSALGVHWAFAGLGVGALIGAAAFTFILMLVSSRSSLMTLLLSGVMLGFFGSSLLTLVMAMSDAQGVQGVLAWLLGDFSRARLSGSLFVLGIVIFVSAMIYRNARELDLFLLGEADALALGVSVKQVRKRLLFWVSVLVAVSVSSCGMIGFIGLVVPHVARHWGGALHRKLLPLSALMGAIALVLADLLARSLVRPQELPAGVVTALLGVPLFFVIVRRNFTGGRNHE